MKNALGAGVGELMLWAGAAIAFVGLLFALLVWIFLGFLQALVVAGIAIFVFGGDALRRKASHELSIFHSAIRMTLARR
jgi:hypothetical protein